MRRVTGNAEALPAGPLRLAPRYWATVEVRPWSDTACEVRLVPRSRWARWWGRRRLRRYCQLAHDAADVVTA